MLKFCLVIFSLLFLTNVQYPNNNEFDENVNKSYEEYAEYYEYTNDSFSLKIIRGRVNKKMVYGVCFSNAYAKTYSIELVDSTDKIYLLPTDKRGDISVVALEEIDKEYTIIVYEDSKLIILPIKVILKPFDETEFKTTDITKVSIGENKGATFTRLSTKTNIPSSVWILGGMVLITIGCVIIILVNAKMKKGMFDKEKRSEGVFNFKKFISEDFNEERKNEFDIIDIAPIEEKDEKLNSEREIYQKTFRYDDDEISGFKIQEYLQDKGFVTDYKLASEEEKQKIMLELMKLKNDKKITEDEYLEEAYKLWKE